MNLSFRIFSVLAWLPSAGEHVTTLLMVWDIEHCSVSRIFYAGNVREAALKVKAPP